MVFRRREFFIYIGLFFFFYGLIHFFLRKYLAKKVSELGGVKKLVFISLMAGLLTVLVLGRKPPYVIYFLPQHTMTLEINADPSLGEQNLEFSITGFERELGDISYFEFVTSGNWEREGNSLRWSGDTPATLKWQGRTGLRSKLYFTSNAEGGKVKLTWDDNIQAIDLATIRQDEQVVEHQFQIPLIQYLPAYLSLFVAASFLIFLLTVFFIQLDIPNVKLKEKKSGFSWLQYAVPMIVIWGVYLAALWPGMMSPDSIDQWQQILTGQFNDSHPVVSTLIMWAITRIWFSPAAIASFQILALSLTAAWGLGYLREIGLPKAIAWIITGLFAISPVNAAIVNTLWKDIPYAVSILLFSILILKIVFTGGRWLGQRLNWLWFGLVGLLIALLRHNGFPIPVVCLILLIFCFKPFAKKIVFSLMTTIGLWLLIRYPVFDLLKVNTDTGTYSGIFLHHIGAHLENGDEMTPEESAAVNSILDADKWVYDCCLLRVTNQVEGFTWDAVAKNSAGVRKTALSLALRHPLTEIKHTLCSSSLVWEVPGRCGELEGDPPYSETNWIAENTLGLHAESLLPDFSIILIRSIRQFRKSDLSIPFRSPAISLYLLIFCVGILAYRKRSGKYLLILLPGMIQSMIMVLVNLAGDQFRYQYPVYLLGLFALGFLFLPKTASGTSGNKLSPEK